MVVYKNNSARRIVHLRPQDLHLLRKQTKYISPSEPSNGIVNSLI